MKGQSIVVSSTNCVSDNRTANQKQLLEEKAAWLQHTHSQAYHSGRSVVAIEVVIPTAVRLKPVETTAEESP